MDFLFCRGLVFLLSITLVFHSTAQDMRKVDSLKRVLQSSTGVNRFDALFGLAYEYANEIESISFMYADQAYDLALKLGDTARIIEGGRIKATELRRLENIDESIQLAQYVLGVAKRHKDTTEIRILLSSLAISYTFKAEYDKALKYNFETLIIDESEGNNNQMSVSLNNIGVIYYKLNDPRKALYYYKKALDLKKETNDKYALDRLLINMGLCFNTLGDYKKSIKYINDGLAACEGTCSDQIIIEGECALGNTLLEMKSYSEALIHLEKSYETSKQIGNHRFQSENLNCMAELYLAVRNYGRASKCLNESESIANQKGYKQLLLQIYRLFSKLHTETGDYKNTSVYQAKYITLNDSIHGNKVSKNLSELWANHEERENLKIIAEKNQVLSLKEELLEKQKQLTLLVGFAGVLLLILTGVIYKNYRDKFLISIRLDQKVKERTEELREVNTDLTKALELRESVFEKVSQETQSIIAAIQGLCRTAQLDLLDEKAREYLQRVDENAGKLISVFSKTEN